MYGRYEDDGSRRDENFMYLFHHEIKVVNELGYMTQ